jgi:hypothetical protein
MISVLIVRRPNDLIGPTDAASAATIGGAISFGKSNLALTCVGCAHHDSNFRDCSDLLQETPRSVHSRVAVYLH